MVLSMTAVLFGASLLSLQFARCCKTLSIELQSGIAASMSQLKQQNIYE
jgi:hypothetical protein